MDDSRPVDKTVAIPVVVGIGAIGECVLWAGYRDRDGYGRRKVDGRMVKAHRHAWALVHGDPGALLVLHRCDNPGCVNVDHLFLGTRADNIADMDAKGRRSYVAAKGQRNGYAKLTDDQALKIRLSTGLLRVVASQYGVSISTVSNIRRRKSWTFLP